MFVDDAIDSKQIRVDFAGQNQPKLSSANVLTLSQTSRGFYVSYENNVYGELSAILIKFEIVVCKLFQFGRVSDLSFGKGLYLDKYVFLSWDRELKPFSWSTVHIIMQSLFHHKHLS